MMLFDAVCDQIGDQISVSSLIMIFFLFRPLYGLGFRGEKKGNGS